ncbi:hypothetical protein SB4_13195 [Sphingomonas sanguinis]|uniref:Uncharacterized protein n=1 Tax=Sphingomonas sanguinis TaxID=33051 RepID=A0A147IQD3_9SPHN|nr:hypothetical protein SB4_13195 [Sphingomonas sanguinis]
MCGLSIDSNSITTINQKLCAIKKFLYPLTMAMFSFRQKYKGYDLKVAKVAHLIAKFFYKRIDNGFVSGNFSERYYDVQNLHWNSCQFSMMNPVPNGFR